MSWLGRSRVSVNQSHIRHHYFAPFTKRPLTDAGVLRSLSLVIFASPLPPLNMIAF